MTHALHDLTELLRQCLVRVAPETIDGQLDGGGSGFWVAPETVMTCGHVVQGPRGDAVTVGWQDKRLPGVVMSTAPTEMAIIRGLWQYPDLALVRVQEPPDHPCAWLCEDSYTSDAPVTAIGHSAVLQGFLDENQVDGRISGKRRFGPGIVWQFVDNEIDEGMSGGPVLNHRTGAVCGMMTTTREMNSNRGGFLVPIEGLRHLPTVDRASVLHQHDQFHAVDRRWTDLRARVTSAQPTSRMLTPVQEVKLLGMVATLPTVPDPARLYMRYTQLTRVAATREPLDLRDCVYDLADEPAALSGEVSGLLRLTDALAADAADSQIRQRLRDWTTTIAAKLDQDQALERYRDDPGAAGRHGSDVVSVRVAASALATTRYQITIWLDRAGDKVTQAYCDEEATHSLAEAKTVICDQLRQILSYLDGTVRIEFVTAVELFDEPFDELVPTKPYTNLGRKYAVVLRDLDRFDDATEHSIRRRDVNTVPNWRRRWAHLQAGTATRLHWLGCRDVPDETTLSATLELDPTLAVLALTRGPSSDATRDAVDVALDHGLPVVLWRRRCPEHESGDAGHPCTGMRFATFFETARTGVPLTGLPELVRQQRNRVHGNTSDAGHDIVLLWDDPDRLPLPFAPLHLPEPRHHSKVGTT